MIHPQDLQSTSDAKNQGNLSQFSSSNYQQAHESQKLITRSGKWTADECQRFNVLYQIYGSKWKIISEKLATRTHEQVRSHFQKVDGKNRKQDEIKKQIQQGLKESEINPNRAGTRSLKKSLLDVNGQQMAPASILASSQKEIQLTHFSEDFQKNNHKNDKNVPKVHETKKQSKFNIDPTNCRALSKNDLSKNCTAQYWPSQDSIFLKGIKQIVEQMDICSLNYSFRQISIKFMDIDWDSDDNSTKQDNQSSFHHFFYREEAKRT